jgi:hypothetical protein
MNKEDLEKESFGGVDIRKYFDNCFKGIYPISLSYINLTSYMYLFKVTTITNRIIFIVFIEI